MFGQIGGQQGIGGPLSPDSIGGESFIRHIGNDKLIFDFHEGSGTTVHDKSREGNDGTLGAGAAKPTWKRNSLYFDGGDKIDIGANFPEVITAGTYSIALCLNTPDIISYKLINIYMVPHRHGINVHSSGLVRGGYYDGSYTGKGGVLGSESENIWLSIVLVNNLGTISFYVNSINQVTSGMADLSTTNRIGATFIGEMDKIRIISKALSQIEVQQEYLVNKFAGNN